MNLVLVSGVSGAGKSTALKALEDLGFFCVDNLPPELIGHLISWHQKEGKVDKLAVSVDVRSKANFTHFKALLQDPLINGVFSLRVLFLEAKNEILVRRYLETRRTHPLQEIYPRLEDALREERHLLGPIRDGAMVLDTSYMRAQSLKKRIQDWVGALGRPFQLILESFGFKMGPPEDADYMFDVRSLPNPYYVPDLRNLNGFDLAVQEFFAKAPEVEAMEQSIGDFLLRWIPSFKDSVRYSLTIALGCTGGRHRSVYLVERLANRLRRVYPVQIYHRELDPY
jgi:UPF0042 nucleotide-binding protein NEIMUCOT_05884